MSQFPDSFTWSNSSEFWKLNQQRMDFDALDQVSECRHRILIALQFIEECKKEGKLLDSVEIEENAIQEGYILLKSFMDRNFKSE